METVNLSFGRRGNPRDPRAKFGCANVMSAISHCCDQNRQPFFEARAVSFMRGCALV